MPLDAICLSAVVRETAAQAENTPVKRSSSPPGTRWCCCCETGGGCCCARSHPAPAAPGGQLRDNPSQPPMFCMLLRKHLAGAHFVRCPGALERVVTLTIQAADELGAAPVASDPGGHAPARHNHPGGSPGPDHRLPAAGGLRDVPAAAGAAGPVLSSAAPGRKRSPLEITREEFLELLSALPEDMPLDGWLLDTFTALPPLMFQERSLAAYGETDAHLSGQRANICGTALGHGGTESSSAALCPPCCAGPAGRPDFTYCPSPNQPGHGQETFDSFGRLLNRFYEGRDQADRVRQKGQDLMKSATAARDQVRRKLAAQEKGWLPPGTGNGCASAAS